ncbi:MAG: class I SAM-dependent methyltransferase, partial [Halobacteriovoraceae bacterium]|nr:class I SAM-dependent methyltransferase [Halobacteriovoraceae bacterium]
LEFYRQLVLDSIGPAQKNSLFRRVIEKNGLVIDVGPGGGFPLLPLAKIFPKVRFLGVEGKKKKVEGIKALISHLKLMNVSCHHIRMEELLIDRPSVLTFKAVGPVENLLPKINCIREVHAFFYKGPKFFEKEDLSKIKKNWRELPIIPYQIPNAEGRILVGFKRNGVSNGKLPKDSGKFIKISELL